MARRVFYSFHYKPDCTRAAKIRNIGVIEGNSPAKDNDWETVTKGGDAAIERWIDGQMKGRSCVVILAGENTANRKWINYEIVQAWNAGMGIVVIYIHGITNLDRYVAKKGANPLDYVTHSGTKKKLSQIAKSYVPTGQNSKEKYAWIAKYLSKAVEEAIKIRSESD